MSWVLTRWGIGHEEGEEGGISDEEQWGSGRYGWEARWDRPCRALNATVRLLGITLQAWSSHVCCLWALPGKGTLETRNSPVLHTYSQVRCCLAP